jgi:hypothetical protein
MDDYMNFWGGYIVPADLPTGQAPPPSSGPSYEEPWYVDTLNRAIERAAQVATIEAGGYPPYPQYPTPTPYPPQGVAPQPSGGGVTLSTNTLMILGLIGFAFVFGGRRR